MEGRSFVRSAVADDGELGPPHLVALVAQIAQLRGFSATEESPELTQEDENGRTVLPQRAEADLTALGVERLDRSESVLDVEIDRRHSEILLVGLGSLTLRADLLQEGLEAWFCPQRVEQRAMAQPNQDGRSRLERSLESV